MGEYNEAEKHFRIAVEVKQVALQSNDNSTATSKGLCRMRFEIPPAQSVTLCFDRSQHAGINPATARQIGRSRNNWT